MIKPEGNVDEALKWFAEYTKAAKKSKGHDLEGHTLVSHAYNPETREIISIDVISGPNAMVSSYITHRANSIMSFHSKYNLSSTLRITTLATASRPMPR